MGTILHYEILAAKCMLLVWLVGFVIGLLHQTHRYLSLVYFLGVRCRSMSEQQHACLPADVTALAPDHARWLLSDKAHGPFCWQMQRPTIVLPTSFLKLDHEVQCHVLRHELEHLAAEHPMQHFLQGLCNTLLWFHPAIRLAARRAEITREYWCDEVAAQSREGVSSYLRSLAIVSEQHAESPPCTLGISDRESAIVLRSHRLAKLMQQRDWNPGSNDSLSRAKMPSNLIILAALLLSQLWLPVNVLASRHDWLSPWPSWTAGALHDVGWTVRDFEPFDHRCEAHEFLNPDD
ncbi:MAG: M56 family metallopeptidase [Planctomycetota bacterium]